MSRLRAFPLLVVAVVLWLGWVATAPLRSGMPLDVFSPYLVSPLLLLGAIVLGGVAARSRHGLAVLSLVAVGGLVLLAAVPMYLNAQAAVGVQLVALAGLALLGKAETGPRATARVGLVAAIAAIGLLLAARSDAAATLVIPLAVLVAVVVHRRDGPRRRPVGAAGAGVLAIAAAAVVWLGSRDAWPDALSASSSLSGARHTLWSDALVLWRTRPLVGAGPGAFRDHSALAASDPDLATVHSSVLQVGAELGLVGCILFAAILISGLGVACLGTRAASAVAVAAWTALGVHSVIDHLYEFPAVVVSAGLVLGWAGAHGRLTAGRGTVGPWPTSTRTR